ncbi:hypothetical protein [Chamaesiphon minutus]|uniref:Uncharacterized protein n=1 Tax=Chamaesiphon minutus (strain ATCC 27169 / PCC 6605) TaxID=1173020 RepID=K9UHS3_CHAP6|nr:hypothetical protein [Chamaesiphon minutus]AFY94001.1 hypothetical protein Cha6605_2969 [Chamaesiphon minutus PCC 6605]
MALDRPTSRLPKLPWISLVLLFLTYMTFGWLLYDWTRNREIWLMVAFAVVAMAAFVTYPSRSVSFGFGGFFKTDVRALILVIIGSIGSVILLTWVQFFVDAVVLCAAGLLVSLDLKTLGWGKVKSLLLIVVWQLLAAAAGLYAHYLYLFPPSNLPTYFYTDYWLQLLARLNVEFTNRLKS